MKFTLLAAPLLSTLFLALGCSSASTPATSNEPDGSTDGSTDGAAQTDAGTSSDGAVPTTDGAAPDAPSAACGTTPLAGPSGTLGAGFQLTTFGTTASVSDGYAVVQPTKTSAGDRPLLALAFTNYAGCGYAKADLGKTGGTFATVVMTASPNAKPFAPGTYASSATGAPPMAGEIAQQIIVTPASTLSADHCASDLVAGIGDGTLTILELTPDHVRGSVMLSGAIGDVNGTFDLPICNYPAHGPAPSCGCAP